MCLSEDKKTMIEEWFSDCTTPKEVANIYSDIKMEVEKQMEYMMNYFVRKVNE